MNYMQWQELYWELKQMQQHFTCLTDYIFSKPEQSDLEKVNTKLAKLMSSAFKKITENIDARTLFVDEVLTTEAGLARLSRLTDIALFNDTLLQYLVKIQIRLMFDPDCPSLG